MFPIVSGLCWFFFFTGTTNCVKFLQSSNILAKHKGTEEIFCSHDDSSLSQMYWYRQARVLALIGYGYSTGEPTYEAEFKGSRFELQREGVIKGSLFISNLTLLDSALYFCAASNTVLQMSTAP